MIDTTWLGHRAGVFYAVANRYSHQDVQDMATRYPTPLFIHREYASEDERRAAYERHHDACLLTFEYALELDDDE